MEKTNYELMLPHEIEQAVGRFPVAYVPFGSLEWHGRHLALGNDTLKVLGILQQACRTCGGVVLPPTYWACVNRWHPWTFGNIGEDLLSRICEHIFENLAGLGFKVIIGVTGHDVPEQVEAMRRALELVKAHAPIEGYVMMEGDLTDFGEHKMDHAAHWETSILMYLLPDCVDLRQIRNDTLGEEHFTPQEWETPGISGRDPRGGAASKELGRKLVMEIAQAICGKARELLFKLEKENRLELGPPPGGRPSARIRKD
jgi:creatinine amidohydrolase